jgi:hypothetical protein
VASDELGSYCETCGTWCGYLEDCWRCPKSDTEKIVYRGVTFKIGDKVTSRGKTIYAGDAGRICGLSRRNSLTSLVKIFWEHKNYTWLPVNLVKHISP